MSESRDFAAFSWVCETCDVGTSLGFDTSAEALDNFNRGHGAMKGLHHGRTAQVRITAYPCDCTDTSRCAKGNALWEAANAVYRGQGHDAWLKALEPYNEHLDKRFPAYLHKVCAECGSVRRLGNLGLCGECFNAYLDGMIVCAECGVQLTAAEIARLNLDVDFVEHNGHLIRRTTGAAEFRDWLTLSHMRKVAK